MCKIIAVTNRQLCKGDFFEQIAILAESGVDVIILREKDLKPEEYKALAKQVMTICSEHIGKMGQTECILHNFIDVAEELQAKKIHLPLQTAVSQIEEMSDFQKIGCSIHSIDQLKQVEHFADYSLKNGKQTEYYVTAGHIFETDCKKGLPPRGTPFLEEICKNTSLPVYAIGGITPENAKSAIQAGADGVCLMSWCMNARYEELIRFAKNLKNTGNS